MPDFLDPSCPWAAYKLGKVLTCEARLCSWVRQPLNTYSSVVFFLAAAYLLRLWGRDRRQSDLVFGLSLLLIGFASALNHASQIKVFVSLDFSAIFVLVSALLALGLRERGALRSGAQAWGLFLLLLTGSAWLQYSYVRYGIPLVALQALLVVGMECVERGKLRLPGKNFLVGLAILAGGALCFYLDASGEICDPANHYFQLHAVWHLACALGLCFLAAHHRRISV